MSAFGTKRTLRDRGSMSAFGGEADMSGYESQPGRLISKPHFACRKCLESLGHKVTSIVTSRLASGL